MFPKDVAGVGDPDGRRWTMLNSPTFVCEPERDGSRSEVAIIIDAKNKICLVAGRADYNGVVKKTIFTVMNYLLPNQGILSMHCSANVGPKGDGAILFGLSGTGKTTLSADPDRRLIGDDETAWSHEGLSNLEDGCYAKLIDLDKEAEPVIAAALSKPGTLVENVPPLRGKQMTDLDPQELDLTDGSVTENTRFSYPLSANPNVMPDARGPHPETIVLLTADAFGVLPPIAVLEGKDVMYHFVSGFTSKLAGTEVGVTEPQAAFSACFGAPFMAHKPPVYAKLLREKDGAARRALHPAQHRLERRALRHRRTHLDQAHARPVERCAQRGPRRGQGRLRAAPGLQSAHADHLPGSSQRGAQPAQHLGRQGSLRSGGREAARHVPQELREQGLQRVGDRAGDVMASTSEKPLYVSKKSAKNLWQEYRVFSDRIELRTHFFGLVRVPMEDVEKVSVRPPVVIFDLFRGDYGIGKLALAPKLDMADANEHVAIEKDTGFWPPVPDHPGRPQGLRRGRREGARRAPLMC